MREIICKFCNQQISQFPQGDIVRIEIYFCLTCKAEFVFLPNASEKFSEAIYATINDNHYKYYYFYDTYSIYSIEKLGVPGKSLNQGQKRIATFKYSLDLTPSNIHERLKNIINFL